MPSTQLSVRLGSDNSIFNHDVPANVKRSQFNFSRKRDFTIEPGAIVPIDIFETVPGDSFEISVEYLLKSMPLAVAPFTSYKIRTHWYYCRLIDIWKGAETFITKGRSGSISLNIPRITSFAGDDFTTPSFYDSPCSLMAYLGLPPIHVADYSSLVSDGYPDNGYDYPYAQCVHSDYLKSTAFKLPYGGVSALPFFMYQKIYRMAYTVPNLLQDNKIWFPDDISDGWRISYNTLNLNHDSNSTGRLYFNPLSDIDVTDSNLSSPSPSINDTAVNIAQLRYALFEDDKFTTALPWAQRGSSPVLDLETTTILSVPSLGIQSAVTINGSKLIPKIYAPSGEGQLVPTGTNIPMRVESVTGTSQPIFGITNSGDTALAVSNGFNSSLQTTAATLPLNVTGINFNLNQFRELVALSVWQERNARTQGDYNSTIYAHFDSNPHSDDYEPKYIGGTSDVISFGEVIQTSESSTTPQGTGTGLASANSSGNVGYFRCPDYGYIMGVMIIQPETVYADSVEPFWFREVMEDFYFPEDEGLGLKEILKKELKPLGTSADDNLFGYQERNTEYKTRDNQAIGWFSVPASVDAMFSAYSQCRKITTPTLNHQFLVMSP